MRPDRVTLLEDLTFVGSGVDSKGRFLDAEACDDLADRSAGVGAWTSASCDVPTDNTTGSASSCESKNDVACAPNSPLDCSAPGMKMSTLERNEDTTDFRPSEHSRLSSSLTMVFHVSAAKFTMKRCLLLNVAVNSPSTCSNWALSRWPVRLISPQILVQSSRSCH